MRLEQAFSSNLPASRDGHHETFGLLGAWESLRRHVRAPCSCHGAIQHCRSDSVCSHQEWLLLRMRSSSRLASGGSGSISRIRGWKLDVLLLHAVSATLVTQVFIDRQQSSLVWHLRLAQVAVENTYTMNAVPSTRARCSSELACSVNADGASTSAPAQLSHSPLNGEAQAASQFLCSWLCKKKSLWQKTN